MAALDDLAASGRTLTSWPWRRITRPARSAWRRYLGFLAGCLAISAALVVLATARIRRVALSRPGGRRPARGGSPAAPRLSRRSPARPVARRQPGGLARVAPPRPSLDDAGRLGPVRGAGLLWVFLARGARTSPGDVARMVGAMNMFQVTLGLLLLSVGAATSLAEERARGSLDVLLSTPMSTRSILAASGGAPSAGSSASRSGRPWTTFVPRPRRAATGSLYVVLLGLVLAYGAAITSLGLAVATWVSRLGRAIALVRHGLRRLRGRSGRCCGLLAWANRDDRYRWAMMVGDPPFGVGFGTLAASATGFTVGPVASTATYVYPLGWSPGSSSTPSPRRSCSWRRWPRSTAAWAGSPTTARRPRLGRPAGDRVATAELLALVPLRPRTERRRRMGSATAIRRTSCMAACDWAPDRCSSTSG